jgi:hypothetical protein
MTGQQFWDCLAISVTSTPTPPLAAPTLTNAGGGVLKWTTVTCAASCNVYSMATGLPVSVANVAGAFTDTCATSAAAGNSGSFEVAAVTSGGQIGTLSSAITVTNP